MSETETEGGAPKRQKLSHEMEQGLNQLAMAGPSNGQPPPKIFKLDVDCFDEIFEYLSLKDLNSFALTCKTMHKVAGEFFKRNYSASEVRMNAYEPAIGRHQHLDFPLAFNQFVLQITFARQDAGALLYFALHPNEFKAINKLKILSMQIDKMTVDSVKSHFSKLESLEISDVVVKENLYAAMLKFCTNLKYLQLHL